MLGRLNQTTTIGHDAAELYAYSNLSFSSMASRFHRRALRGYKELVNGRADRYADRYAPVRLRGNADFTVLSFRTTNVLRWEFKPGSTLFVVWQQGREGFRPNGVPLRPNYGDIFDTPSSNTFLVKIPTG